MTGTRATSAGQSWGTSWRLDYYLVASDDVPFRLYDTVMRHTAVF
jgi:hypothetical protein